MPKLVNRNAHRVSVRQSEDPTHPRRRVAPGEVVDADGVLADSLLATNGIEEANSDDEEAWNNRGGRHTTEGQSRRLKAKARIGDARNELRRYHVVGPLQVVVGDNQAPYGPGNGVITTKQAVATESVENRQAFADHEALEGEKVEGAPPLNPLLPRSEVPKQTTIHNAQVDASESARQAGEQVILDRAGGEQAEGEVEGQPGAQAAEERTDSEESSDESQPKSRRRKSS